MMINYLLGNRKVKNGKKQTSTCHLTSYWFFYSFFVAPGNYFFLSHSIPTLVAASRWVPESISPWLNGQEALSLIAAHSSHHQQTCYSLRFYSAMVIQTKRDESMSGGKITCINKIHFFSSSWKLNFVGGTCQQVRCNKPLDSRNAFVEELRLQFSLCKVCLLGNATSTPSDLNFVFLY